jgi:hypothetical protein
MLSSLALASIAGIIVVLGMVQVFVCGFHFAEIPFKYVTNCSLNANET